MHGRIDKVALLVFTTIHPATVTSYITSWKMVEGHSVHRVATKFRRQGLVGKTFRATSPNGRFTEGAAAINGQPFCRIEAVGKNLFAFFGPAKFPEQQTIVHVHFGMAGAWATYVDGEETIPEPTPTTRLRLEHPGIVADLSAMTVQHGGLELYTSKKAALGQDPLRDDADPDLLWSKIQKSNKSIGALVMDQSFFTGPGNIYRAEILFKAGIHPDIPGKELEKHEFDVIWQHTVELLQRGYQCGSILTVDPKEAKALGKPGLRRYIYNSSTCPRCSTSIKVWTIASRTCYACPKCQPRSRSAAVVTPESSSCVPFNSHCARESVATRLAESGPSRLTVQEIKDELEKRGVEVPSSMKKKAGLVEMLEQAMLKTKSVKRELDFISSEDAAREKAAAGENLAVEHIAELGPAQARRARKKIKVDKKKK
jgi:formamidopyrimidine-DNA glycosylase